MNRIALVLRELHRSENAMARALLLAADRHRVEHEVVHVARDIARWSQDHVRSIAEPGHVHGVHLARDATTGAPKAVGRLAQRASALAGRRPEPGLLLLADLLRLPRRAVGVSMDWELLARVVS